MWVYILLLQIVLSVIFIYHYEKAINRTVFVCFYNCTSSNTAQIQKILHNKSIESPMIIVECKTGTTKHRVPKLIQQSKQTD